MQATLGQRRPARGHEHVLPSEEDWTLLEELQQKPDGRRKPDADSVDAREPSVPSAVREDDLELLGVPFHAGEVSTSYLLPLGTGELQPAPRTPSQRLPGTPAPLPPFAQSHEQDDLEPATKRSRRDPVLPALVLIHDSAAALQE